MKKFLFEQTDNAPLIVFRIFFGFLLACETLGAILTGWVKANFIDPEFTFSHIGMEWLQPLPGYGMYLYFGIMALLGIMVMLGYKYRFSIASFTVLWAGVYFMQKTSYNNHYYLLLLISLMMCFLPAHRYRSIDVAQNPSLAAYSMPAWCRWVMVVQISLVYFFATLAKFYPAWLSGDFTLSLLSESIANPTMHSILATRPFALFIAYAGIVFDLIVVPLLLWRKTRFVALVASLAFHIFNSITLKIGIFPFFALTFVVFMYPPEHIRSVFMKKKPRVLSPVTDQGKAALLYFFIPFLLIQFALPLRHHFIKGDVLWTEEGHRLSWRMMLRSRSGSTVFTIKDKATGNTLVYDVYQKLTPKQHKIMEANPDMIWQMAQRIKQHFAKQGKEVAVYASSRASVNNGPMLNLIDPQTDLAAAKWNYFSHCPWIILYDNTGNPVK
jgi:vitamin K-dependent gamma-carboxylase